MRSGISDAQRTMKFTCYRHVFRNVSALQQVLEATKTAKTRDQFDWPVSGRVEGVTEGRMTERLLVYPCSLNRAWPTMHFWHNLDCQRNFHLLYKWSTPMHTACFHAYIRALTGGVVDTYVPMYAGLAVQSHISLFSLVMNL